MVIVSLVFMACSCVIIWRASDGFDAASEFLGRNLSEGVRGATINAIGSSVPELLTTFFFLIVMNDEDGFASGIGTTAGSAIFNGMIIPASVILLVILKRITKSINVSRKVLFRDGITLLIFELIVIIILGGKALYWYHGLFLMCLYILYATYMVISMKRNRGQKGSHISHRSKVSKEVPRHSSQDIFRNIIKCELTPFFMGSHKTSLRAWLLLLVSVVIMGLACLILVFYTEKLGKALDIPVYFVAIILASAATSVPDTFLSLKDASKGNYDDAVSNALGSNIFDICFALGFPLFVYTLMVGPIEMQSDRISDISAVLILLFIFTMIAVLVYTVNNKMGLGHGVILSILYIVFSMYIIGISMDVSFFMNVKKALLNINESLHMFRF